MSDKKSSFADMVGGRKASASMPERAKPKEGGFSGGVAKKSEANQGGFQDATNGRIVYFVKDSSQPAWFYMLVTKEKLPILEYRLSLTEGETELTDYGDIIASGWGEEPPEDTVDEIREKYGAA